MFWFNWKQEKKGINLELSVLSYVITSSVPNDNSAISHDTDTYFTANRTITIMIHAKKKQPRKCDLLHLNKWIDMTKNLLQYKYFDLKNRLVLWYLPIYEQIFLLGGSQQFKHAKIPNFSLWYIILTKFKPIIFTQKHTQF